MTEALTFPRRYASSSSPRMDCALAASFEIMGSVGVRKLKPGVFFTGYLGVAC